MGDPLGSPRVAPFFFELGTLFESGATLDHLESIYSEALEVDMSD